MPHYRVYLLDEDRHIVAVREVECQSDETALVLAAGKIDGYAGAEVWLGARVIGYVPSGAGALEAAPDG